MLPPRRAALTRKHANATVAGMSAKKNKEPEPSGDDLERPSAPPADGGGPAADGSTNLPENFIQGLRSPFDAPPLEQTCPDEEL